MPELTNTEKNELAFAAAAEAVAEVHIISKRAVTGAMREAETEEFLKAFGESYATSTIQNSDDQVLLRSNVTF